MHVKNRLPPDIFFRSLEPNRVPEMSLSYLQSMPTYYPLEKFKFSICSFLKYCHTTVFVDDISYPSKNVDKICSALNLTIICIKLFT